MKAAVHPLREITVGVDQPETGREKGRADWERLVVRREGLTGKAEVTFVARGLAG